MKTFARVRLSPVARQVLDYLQKHPAAQDTLEGIAEWWLLDQRIRRQIAEIKKALDELVKKEIVLERKARDGRTHYRLRTSGQERPEFSLREARKPRNATRSRA